MDFTDVALRRAKKSDCRYTHCAVIFDGKKIVSIGHNRRAKQSMKREGMHTIHAEHDALMKLNPMYNLAQCTMYVYRFNNDGHPRLSKPCERCASRLRASGIKEVYYTISKDDNSLEWEKLPL